MSTVSKYWDKYRERHRSESVEKPDVNKLMTDKQAYISFLEVQLERVTQSVLTTQGFSDRIESIQSQLNSSDEKIINLTRLIKLQQSYAESQEEEINQLKKTLESNHEVRSAPGLDKKIQYLEEKFEYYKPKDSKYEDFVKEVETALKATEFKITELLSNVTEEMDAKQKKYQKSIESSLELCSNQMTENYKDLSKKIQKDPDIENKIKKLNSRIAEIENKTFGKRIEYDDYDKDDNVPQRLLLCETGLKELENFLVAIADEVKKIEEKHLDTSDIEYRISEKLNSKVEKLGELVKKTLVSKKDTIKPHMQPEKIDLSKESPKFPGVSSISRSYQEDIKPRTKSKDSESSNSHEKASKSPKSVTSRSKKSNSSSRTPKSKKSNSSSRTPKAKKSLSPNTTPTRRKEIISPVGTPKAITKSKAMEASIRQKLKQIKAKDPEEKKIATKKDEKKKTKKKTENKSKLDKLYQELSGKI
jgi:hypothetical protein